MRAENFAYWLQGYFELIESHEEATATVSKRQKAVIRNHLELVKQCSKTPLAGFCAWLDGALDMAPVVNSCIVHEALEKIKSKLNDEFLHVIDPKMPGDSEVLQAVHDGLQLPSPHHPYDRRIRC